MTGSGHGPGSGAEITTDRAGDLERLLGERIIEPADFVADTEAFVDVRIPRSKGKASYSFIGPGVSQNSDQLINLVEPHGFQVGAASMPSGVVNNPHLHFTAEVFICTRGSFRLHVGEHGDQAIDVEPGTVFSAPTWVFRGFENTGPDDSWLFVVLGGDDTGGIIWAPEILAEAAETGLHLDRSNAVLDANAGDDVSDAIRPFTAEQLATVDHYSDEQLAARTVTAEDLVWSDRALLSSVVGDHRTRLAPVIGNGMTQDRSQRSPVPEPHTFSLEWLEVAPGSSTGSHRHDDTQALLLVEGTWRIELGDGSGAPAVASPATGSVVSIPPGLWRNLANTGDTPARAVVVCGSDAPTRIEWDPTIVAAAATAGWAIDAGGSIAPAHLLGAGPARPAGAPTRTGTSPTAGQVS